MATSAKLNNSDFIGATVSFLCAVHCTLTPLIFAVKPVMESTMHHEHAHGHGFWAAFDYIFLVLSLLAVWFSARRAARPFLKWALWIAWLVFAAGLLTESLELSFSKWMMYAGSIALIIFHLQNHRECKIKHTVVPSNN